MTNSPNQPQSPSPTRRRLWLMLLSRGGITLVAMILLGTIAGVWRLWTFVQQDLAPLAAQSLTTTLNRPVKLGKLKDFSITGVRFAASSIPATPTDPDSVNIESIEANFNLWELILHRHLKLDVTLVNPDIYLEQDNQERWITTTIAPPGKPGLIQTDLDKLRLRNGKLWLQPFQKIKSSTQNSLTTVGFSQLNGTAQLLNQNKLVQLDITALPNSGGNLAVQGDMRPGKALDGDLKVQAKDFLAADVTRLIKLPVTLKAGRVNTELQVKLIPGEKTLLYGTAALQKVTLKIPDIPQLLNNIQGNVHFQGLEIQLDKVTTNFGKIPLVATGSIDQVAGFNLAAQIINVSLATAQETLKIKLPVIAAGNVKADLQVVGAITNPTLLGNITNLKTIRLDKINLESASADFLLSTKNKQSRLTIPNIQAKPTLGGEVTGRGVIQLGKLPQLAFNFDTKNIPGDAIARVYNFKPPYTIGNVAARIQLARTNQVQTLVQWQAPGAIYPGSGEIAIAPDRTIDLRNATFNVGGGIVRAVGRYSTQGWSAIAQVDGIPLTPFVDQKKLQNISFANSQFNGRIFLSGSTAPFKLLTIRTEGSGVKIAGGTVAITDVQVQNQNFVTKLVANNIRLGQILKQSPPVLNNPLAGTFQLSGNTDNFNLKALRGIGEGHLDVGVGRIIASNILLADGRYQAGIELNNLPLQQLATIPKQVEGGLAGKFQVSGSAEFVNLQTLKASGAAILKVAGGTVTSSNIQVADGRYNATVNSAGVQLNQFNQQLLGQLGATLQVGGRLDSVKLADISANGNLAVTSGVPILPPLLLATINWNGEKLEIKQATGPNVKASGYILANAQKIGIPEITQLNLNVQAQNYNLQWLPVKIPSVLGITGKVDFNGLVAGKLPIPNITGQLGFRDLAVKGVAFDPLLTGNLTYIQGSGLNVDLLGKSDGKRPAAGDHLALRLDADNRPQSFLVKWQQASASGIAKGDDLAVKIKDFPLKVLNLRLPMQTALGNGIITGLLNGDLQLNQKTLATQGNIAIAKPEISRIKGDKFSTIFSYNNGKTTLTNSEFIKGDSQYTFNANILQTVTGVPQVQAKINIAKGNIQDVLSTVQIFELADLQRGINAPSYGTAADLITKPQGLPNQPLLTQLQRLYEIDVLLAEQEQKRLDSQPIPALADLKGIFNGDISIDTASINGLSAEFHLKGENFTWGKETEPNRFYRADKVIAKGSFEKGVLRLQPLRIRAENRLIAFTGNIGGQEQSGQLRVQNFPVQLLSNFVKNLPVGISGNLNGTAALAGSISNPQARGELEVTEGTLNQKKIETATGSFSYANGRLNFGSTVSAAGPEPVNITGSIPYKLPFASVEPDSNQITLDVKVKNEGLTLLNLFTSQIAFENGQGEVDIKVTGTREKPLVEGIASLNNASFSAQALPGKLTNVNGKAQFNSDRVIVESLKGNFSKGTVEAAGEIPIFNNEVTKIDNPLQVNLDKLTLNLKALYQGNASGNLQITGSILKPVIGGKVKLFDGQVLLSTSDTAGTSGNSSFGSSSTTANNPNQSNADTGITQLDNLELKLGEKVKISLPPVINFSATGDLKVNGLLNNPIPEGTIKLTQGGVNLFTTQFNLVSGYKQTATFRANQPRDPDLDVRLFAKVLDATQSSNFNRQSSIGLASLEGVRVEATVKGLASKINDNLELKSSPARSETEIVTLLGGGFVNTQGKGDSTLGLINIAGSAVFNNFQGAFNQIGNAFGLSELRLFPTILSNRPESGKSGSSIELALEAGVDISSRISVSSIKILTASDPFQWGINYRINNEVRVRASTNLTDDSRAVVEFERRF